MKKTVLVFLAVIALALGSSLPADAFQGGGRSGGGHVSSGHLAARGHFGGAHFRGHGPGHFGVGVVIAPELGPWWWDSYPYYPYPSSPVVLQGEPEANVEPQLPEQNYWHYCSDPAGYYPYLKECPKGWMKVLPTPAPAGAED